MNKRAIFLINFYLFQFVLAAKNEDYQILISHINELYEKYVYPLSICVSLFGLMQLFGGIRLFKVTTFFIGFVVFGICSVFATESIMINFSPSDTITIVSSIILFIVGLISGILLTQLEPLGHFVLALLGGSLMGCYIATFIIFVAKLHSHLQMIILICTLSGGLFIAVLQCCVEISRIFSFAFLGSYLTTFGIGNLVGDFPNPINFVAISEEYIDGYPKAWWIYLIIIVALGVIGAFIQIFLRPPKENIPSMNVPDVLVDDKINKKLRKQLEQEKARKKLKPLPGSSINSISDRPEKRHTLSLRQQRELDMNSDVKYSAGYVPINPFKGNNDADIDDDNDVDSNDVDLDVNINVPKRKKSYF